MVVQPEEVESKKQADEGEEDNDELDFGDEEVSVQEDIVQPELKSVKETEIEESQPVLRKQETPALASNYEVAFDKSNVTANQILPNDDIESDKK